LFKCDGVQDCKDGLDEEKCPVYGCNDDEFMCKNSYECIEIEKQCDGISDCYGGSDEDEKSCAKISYVMMGQNASFECPIDDKAEIWWTKDESNVTESYERFA
jgi:hypothetical protein